MLKTNQLFSITQLEKRSSRIRNWSAWLQSPHLTAITSLSVFLGGCKKKVTNQVADKLQKCIRMIPKGGKPKIRAAAENVFCGNSCGRVTELPWASCIIPKLLWPNTSRTFYLL